MRIGCCEYKQGNTYKELSMVLGTLQGCSGLTRALLRPDDRLEGWTWSHWLTPALARWCPETVVGQTCAIGPSESRAQSAVSFFDHWDLCWQIIGLGLVVTLVVSSQDIRRQKAVTLILPPGSFYLPVWCSSTLLQTFGIALTRGQRDLPVPVQIKQIIFSTFPSWRTKVTWPGQKQNGACLWPHAHFVTWVQFPGSTSSFGFLQHAG